MDVALLKKAWSRMRLNYEKTYDRQGCKGNNGTESASKRRSTKETSEVSTCSIDVFLLGGGGGVSRGGGVTLCGPRRSFAGVCKSN